MSSISWKISDNVCLGLMGALLTLWVAGPSMAQKSPAQSSEMHEMLLTKDGLLAIDSPKGWVQSEGPGLAFFLPEGVDRDKAEAWIYISSAPIGPREEDKDINAYIQSDIAGYKQRFKGAVVRREEDLVLPEMKHAVTVYSFQSGQEHNEFEEVVYIPDTGRVLILALSAKTSDALKGSMNVFREFAKTYRGSIQTESPRK